MLILDKPLQCTTRQQAHAGKRLRLHFVALTASINEAPAYPIIWRLAPGVSEARKQQQPHITCQQAGLTQNVWHVCDAAQQEALTRKAVAAKNIQHSMGNYVCLADQAIIKPAEAQEDVFAPGVTIYKSPACKKQESQVHHQAAAQTGSEIHLVEGGMIYPALHIRGNNTDQTQTARSSSMA